MHLKKLGRYDLVRVLGKGAMGVVYEGRDPNLDRHVAIKTIMVDGLGSQAAAEYEERFRTEARSAARLQHPNIVTVYDSDRDGDTAFLVMEFVAGDDLKQLLDGGGRYAVKDALHLVHDLLAALDFAHRQGIIHRDIKPANLLVEAGGRVKLTDFGVARIAGEATRTQGSMIGTLKYMAPEQVQGLKVDSRADLFSAAVVTYQLLTGVRPFDGDNDFSIIHQVLGHTPPAPSTIAPSLPAEVDAVMARAMAKDREARFPTAAEFWQALREAFPALELPVLPVPQAQARVPSPPLAPTRPPSRAVTIPGAPITHEMELEYWRDVRDSTDPRELEGFLERFPEGVYADLARRRLQRLSHPEDPEMTVLRGMTRVPIGGTRTSPPASTEGSTLTGTLPEPEPGSPEATERAWQALVAAQLAGPLPASATKPSASTSAARSGAARSAKSAKAPKRPKVAALPWMAGTAAVAVGVAAIAFLAFMRSPAPDVSTATAAVQTADAAEPARAASAGGATASAPVTAKPAPAGTAAVAASPAPAVRPVATVAARPSDAPVSSRAPVATAAAGAPATGSAHAAVLEQARPDETAHAGLGARSRLVPPAETCKDKFFLVKEFCLQAECAKPGYQNFPACVRLKEEARLRDESRVRN